MKIKLVLFLWEYETVKERPDETMYPYIPTWLGTWRPNLIFLVDTIESIKIKYDFKLYTKYWKELTQLAWIEYITRIHDLGRDGPQTKSITIRLF